MTRSLREALDIADYLEGQAHLIGQSSHQPEFWKRVAKHLRRAVKDTERVDWLTRYYFSPEHWLGSRKKIDAVIRAENKPANLRIPLPIADLTRDLRPRRKRG